MNDEKLLRIKRQFEEKKRRNDYYNGYLSYIKHRRRKLKIIVDDYENKLKEKYKTMSAEFKLRKQYSKNYQVVELEVSGDLDQFDVLANWLDDKINAEMQAIPGDLLVKDNAGSKATPAHFQKKTPQQYNANRKTYNAGGQQPNHYGKPFGSPKQWDIIAKNEARLLEDFGLTPEDITDKQQLADAIGQLMQR
jgi:hypothetical protein